MSAKLPWLLVLCHEFPPLGGGCGRNLFALCRELARRGMRLEVWTMAAPAAELSPSFPFAVRRFEVGRRAVFETKVRRLLRYAAAVWSAGKRVETPPAAVFSAMAFPAGWVGVRLSRCWDVAHFVWYHGSDVHGGKTNGPNILIGFYLRWLFRNTQGNFFVSSALQRMAEKIGQPPHLRLLPPCPAEEVRAFVPPAGGVSPQYFLWAGRLEAVKDPLLFVRSITILKNSAPDSPPVRMAGGGSLRRTVSRAAHAANAGIALEAPIPAARMPEVLHGAWAVVLTSRAEGFSTLLLEAACLGVPTVACDVPGVREFLRHEENGLLVPPRPEALAEGMLRLWRDPDLRRRLGAQARRDAEAFTPTRNADILLDVWRAQDLQWNLAPAGVVA